MTPERIAEIELDWSDGPDAMATGKEMRELCRLALLGKRVEEARKCICRGYEDVRRLAVSTGREKLIGKRVALVVLP